MINGRKFLICFVLFCLIAGSVFSATALVSEPSERQRKTGGIIAKPDVTPEVKPADTAEFLYPLSTTPVFVEQGGWFNISFRADECDELFVYLSTAYEPVVDEFWLSITQIDYGLGMYQVTVFVPAEVPVELYNITVLLNHDMMFSSIHQPRAVSVVDAFTDDFTFVHITDFHVGDPRGFVESIRQTLGQRSIRRCIDEINLLHPDFVIISGDLVFGQLYFKEYSREYPLCYELLQKFDVPTFVCPGNHDGYKRPFEDGFDFWKKYFGPLYYSFDFGDFHFLSINSYDWPAINRWSLSVIPLNWGGSIQQPQLQWIEQDLASHQSALTFMFMHHNPLWDTTQDSLLGRGYQNRENLVSLIDQYDVDMVLAGHVHFDNVTQVNDTIYLTTTTPESQIEQDDGYWGYRLITIADGAIESYNYKEPKYSIPSYHLEAIYHGSSMATVKNDLELDVVVLLCFVLPLEEYTVNVGDIIFERANEQMVELYVQVPVEQQSSRFVRVSHGLAPLNK